MNVEVQSSSHGHIDDIVSHDQRRWKFTGFYGNSQVEKQKISWQLLLKLSSTQELSHLPLPIGGDFNKILFDFEKKGGRPWALHQMRDFQSTLDLCGAKYLSFSREQFTWANKQEDGDFVQAKLHRFA